MDVTHGEVGRAGAGWRAMRSRFRLIKPIAAAAFSVAVLVAAIAFVVVYTRNSAAVSRYDSAPRCELTAALSSSCRYVGQATVVRVYNLDRVQAVVAFDSLPGRTYNTSFPIDGQPPVGKLNEGATTTAEVWNGRITHLADTKTFDIPYQRPTTSLLSAAAALAALGLLMLFLSWLMAREVRGWGVSTRS